MVSRLFVGAVVVSLLVAGGCNMPAERLNAPPHGHPYATSDTQGTLTYMADNALLADMTMGDMHFLPHRAQLNDLGTRRLSRLVSLMDAYGGTIRFNTELTDKDLIARRSDTIMDFLAQAGIDTTREVLVQEMPGGRGMPATEAVLIKTNVGTYVPKKASPSTSTGTAGTAK